MTTISKVSESKLLLQSSFIGGVRTSAKYDREEECHLLLTNCAAFIFL